MNIYSDAIVQKSSTTTPPPQAKDTVTKIGQLIDVTKCIGCKACTAACFVWNETRDEVGDLVGIYDPGVTDLSAEKWSVMRFAEIDTPDGGVEWLMRKDGCMHCEQPGCLKACPAPGAIVKYANGVVDFNQANCIGCGYCVAGCPFNIPRISKKDNKAYKCSMCNDRLEVGLAPVCVKTCPSGAISFGTFNDMKAVGEKRVDQLKQRGFQNAALYNPQGVGGTHVMYVLKHGDQPELYNDLPKDPKVSPWVGLWRGAAKPVMSLGLGVAALGLFFHYLTRGPQEEDAGEAHGSDKATDKQGGEKS